MFCRNTREVVSAIVPRKTDMYWVQKLQPDTSTPTQKSQPVQFPVGELYSASGIKNKSKSEFILVTGADVEVIFDDPNAKGIVMLDLSNVLPPAYCSGNIGLIGAGSDPTFVCSGTGHHKVKFPIDGKEFHEKDVISLALAPPVLKALEGEDQEGSVRKDKQQTSSVPFDSFFMCCAISDHRRDGRYRAKLPNWDKAVYDAVGGQTVYVPLQPDEVARFKNGLKKFSPYMDTRKIVDDEGVDKDQQITVQSTAPLGTFAIGISVEFVVVDLRQWVTNAF